MTLQQSTPSSNQPITSHSCQDRVAAVRRLNDTLRIHGRGGCTMVTPGVSERVAQSKILEAVRTFDAFTPDNDPYGEHDFGSITIDGETFFWKIDAYDQSLTAGSPDPTNPAVTCRVLTIMHASEY